MQKRILLRILLLAQHVSGTTMPIIWSSIILYSGCCLWYFVLWFSCCWSGVELRVMCPVCRMLQQSLSWETNRFSISQEILHILWTPKVHYHTHKCPPPVLILSQINPVHASHPTSRRSILILSSHLFLGLPSTVSPSPFPAKPLYAPLLFHTRATCPANFMLLDFIIRHLFNMKLIPQIK